jgi:hypothetical protein
MILRIDLDLDNPIATKVSLDGKQVGGMQRLALTLDLYKDLFMLDVSGINLKEKEKAIKTFASLGYYFKSVYGGMRQQLDYTKKTLADLVETLKS